MNLSDNYYPCFMGNGLDAVLIGYNGSMEPDKVGVDRCAWYKADRYYPEERLVMVAGRFPIDKPLEHAEGSGWFEIAPLGHTWYDVVRGNQVLTIQQSTQEFNPSRGLLHTHLDFGSVRAEVTTFLHATESLLVEHYEFNDEVEFRAWMAPGVWVEDGWDTDPFHEVRMEADQPEGWYDLGETQGRLFLHLEGAEPGVLKEEKARGLRARGRAFTKYFCILDNRQEAMDEPGFMSLIAPGYDTLLAEQVDFWQEYSSRSKVTIPDEQFQRFYEASHYHIKAAQNRLTGGLPVNNLRRTWSSHIFWDSYYLQRVLLEANHVTESREMCRFLEGTQDHARRHAQEEFEAPGLKWDWEITQDGRKAYGTLLHMKYQVHNNGSYANELWQHYWFTRDRAYLEEVYPILEGLAIFFMHAIVEKTDRGYEVGSLVGVNESPIRVRNEGMNLSAAAVILDRCAAAARILGRESDFTRECEQAAAGLKQAIGRLFNGRFFVSAEGRTGTNTASIGVIYPLSVVPFDDPRAVLTAEAVYQDDLKKLRESQIWNFPWHWGVVATILACQGKGAEAWQAIQQTRPTICEFGGMAEVLDHGEWNMQYFLTAQAAVVTALHSLMLQGRENMVSIFPAMPSEWKSCSFANLLSNGLLVTAAYENGAISGEVKNISPEALERTLVIGKNEKQVKLDPGETCALQTPR